MSNRENIRTALLIVAVAALAVGFTFAGPLPLILNVAFGGILGGLVFLRLRATRKGAA